jgi:hypothetical protein
VLRISLLMATWNATIPVGEAKRGRTEELDTQGRQTRRGLAKEVVCALTLQLPGWLAESAAACRAWVSAPRESAITNRFLALGCDSLLFDERAPAKLRGAPRPLSEPTKPKTESRAYGLRAGHGLSQVGRRLGDGQGPSVSLLLRRQGRPRPLHLDPLQRHTAGMYSRPHISPHETLEQFI